MFGGLIFITRPAYMYHMIMREKVVRKVKEHDTESRGIVREALRRTQSIFSGKEKPTAQPTIWSNPIPLSSFWEEIIKGGKAVRVLYLCGEKSRHSKHKYCLLGLKKRSTRSTSQRVASYSFPGTERTKVTWNGWSTRGLGRRAGWRHQWLLFSQKERSK